MYYVIYFNRTQNRPASDPRVIEAENKKELRRKGFRATYVAGAERYNTLQAAKMRLEELK